MATKSVFTVNGQKIKTYSQADAERLYAKDHGSGGGSGDSPAPKSNVDVITDPVTKKQYSRDLTDPASKYVPYVPPTGAPRIGADTIGTSGKLTIPPASSFDTAGALVESIKPLLSSTKDYEKASKDYAKEQARLGGYYDQLATKGTRSEQVYNDYNIPSDLKKLQEMTMAITQRSGEFDKLEAGLEGQGRGIPLSIVTGQQAAVRRQKAAEIGAQTAIAEALKGNIELSTQLADRSIELEFGDIETNIQRTKDFLALNRERMTDAQKEQADQLNLYLDDQKTALEQKKQDRKDILAYAAEVAQNGGATVASQISKMTDVNAAFALAAPYIGKLDREKTNSSSSDSPAGPGAPSKQKADYVSEINDLMTNGLSSGGQTVYAGRGSDGFTDPGAYIAAFQDWLDQGGTVSEFLTKWPPAKNVNPASYSLLPAAIRPAKKKGEAGSLSNPYE